MLKLWLKVMVKECQPDGEFNWVIYSDNHGNYKFVEGIVVRVIWDKQDKCSLDFDTDMIFWEDMLEVIDSPYVEDNKQSIQQMVDKWDIIPIVNVQSTTRAKDLVEELKAYREWPLSKIRNNDIKMTLYEDKLRSLLLIYYGW